MFLQAGGHWLNTVQIGSAERTFVAHGGWVGGWELWQQPMELMQSQWRSIAFDHRGSGASTAPPEAVDPRGLIDDLFTVLAHYGVERCVLSGESMGAQTCLNAVIERPELFSGLVLVDGAPGSDDGEPPNTDRMRADYATYVAGFVDTCIPESDSDHLRRWARQILLRADPVAAARMLESNYEQGIVPDLPKVTVPTLVLHGALDSIVPPSFGEEMAAAIPDAEYVVIPGAGHVPTLTRPQLVVDAINSWVARIPSR